MGSIGAAALLTAGGASARNSAKAANLYAAFSWAWLIAGILNVAIALIQVFTPDLPDATGSPVPATSAVRSATCGSPTT